MLRKPESPVKSSWHHGPMFARRIAAAGLVLAFVSCATSVTRTREIPVRMTGPRNADFRADASGEVKVDVRAGSTTSRWSHLFARDKENPSDSLDLVAQTSGYAGVPRCE